MNRSQLVPADPTRTSELAMGSGNAFHSAPAEQALFRMDLRRSLEMHRGLALGIALCGLVLAAAYLFRYWSNYTAETLVYIQPTPAGSGGTEMHWPYNYDPATYDSYIQQQILSMTRPDVLKGALAKVAAFEKSGESEQDAAERLGHSVEAARDGNSYQVSIKAHAGSAPMAADIANALAASYIESTSHEQRAGDAERLTILREEAERVKKELTDDRTEQAALNAQLGVAAIGATAPEHYDDDIGRIHDELVKARADRDDAEARLTSLGANGGDVGALNAAADDAAATDSGLNSLKQALDLRRAALVSQMANLTPNHPQYKQDEAELAQIDASLDAATRDLRTQAAGRIQEKLRADLSRTAGVESRLNGELGQMTRAAAGATPKLQRASDLAGDIARLQTRYNAIDEQLQNQLIEDAAPGTAHVTNAAVPPAHAAENGVMRNAGILMFAFLMLALFAAVAAHKMDPRLYAACDVEEVLGFAPLAQLPDFGEVSGEMAEEHMLRLSAAIEHALKQGNLKSCIFIGTAPGAGVTTIATRVHAMLEGMGRSAVLVDAAGARPVVWPSASTHDKSVSPGTRPLVLIQRLTEEARVHDGTLVLTDTAPLIMSAETEYLARNTDCAIVVMESGVTTRAQLRATAGALQRLDVAAVGFVLNRVGLAKADAAFRNSVRAVESHLRVASRPMEEQPVRTRKVEAEPAAAPRPPARESVASAPPAAASAAPQYVAAAAAPRQAVPAAAQRVAVPAAPAPPPPARIAAPAPPAPQPESDIPWWLADPMLQPRTPAVPVLASTWSREAEPAAAVASPEEAARITRELRISGLRNLVSSRPAEVAPAAAAQPPQAKEAFRREAVPEPAYEAREAATHAPEPVYQTPAFDAGSVSLSVPEPEAAPAAYAIPEPEPEPAYAQEIARGDSLRVTATPEFLPPRKTREAHWEDDAAARRDRRDTIDDVAILPSWRGQYRRKT